MYLRVTDPFAASPCGLARLACLIHTASVHPEPGSNSLKFVQQILELFSNSRKASQEVLYLLQVI